MKQKVVFIVLIFLALLLRTYQLQQVPYGIRNDEAYIFVNALTISETGKDIHGFSFPLIFRPVNGITTTPIPIYLSALSIKLFGFSMFSVKLPTILFSLLGLFLVYRIALELTENKYIGLGAIGILSVSPWHMYVSRTGFEAMIAYSFVLAGIYYLITCVKKNGSILPVMLMFILSSFTYKAVNIVLIGITIVFIIYAKLIKRNIKKAISIFVLTLILIASVWKLHVNIYNDLYSTDILKEQTTKIENIVNKERKESSAPFWLQKIISNKLTVRLQLIGSYYLNFFSLDNLFLPKSGQDDAYSMANYGMLYLFEIIVIPLGIYWNFKKSRKNTILLLLLLLVMPTPVLISSPVYPLRCLGAVYILAIFTSSGFMQISDYIESNRISKLYTLLPLSSLYIFSILIFFYLYFYRFAVVGYDVWQSYDMEAFKYIAQNQKKYNKIMVIGVGENEFLQYVFWNNIASESILSSLKNKRKDMIKFENIHFYTSCPDDSDVNFPKLGTKDLLVARYGCFPKHTVHKSITYPKDLKIFWNIFNNKSLDLRTFQES